MECDLELEVSYSLRSNVLFLFSYLFALEKKKEGKQSKLKVFLY